LNEYSFKSVDRDRTGHATVAPPELRNTDLIKEHPMTFDGKNLPSQRGTTALVTGANSGIGFETALALARAGAAVWLGGRDVTRLDEARARIADEVPGATTTSLRLDLADLSSIAEAAEIVLAGGHPLDLLINNAGVMAIPDRRLTRDGFELTFGTNHLGHFALTGRLSPALLKADHPRVVEVSALVSRNKGVTFDDPQSEHDYTPMGAYAKSKLANVLFIEELTRRAENTNLIAVAVHPGTSMTGLQRHSSRVVQVLGGLVLDRFIGQSTDQAALPSLYAATRPEVESGDFFAPTGRRELRGAPGRVPLPPAAEDRVAATTLWEYSEEVTGVRFAFDPATGASG
jgi:NAD(P)-dependent dehydrogenase (short-subunit alcohol dehydrogenase family)